MRVVGVWCGVALGVALGVFALHSSTVSRRCEVLSMSSSSSSSSGCGSSIAVDGVS